ncbi:GPW/gp25 family protein [Flavobacterium sp. J27]|uniref:GPW/gp25 family protein n=1 Tax=Flavobacterium sp. J27 TaxID=2060419 RepID=UPI0010312561|nr:GPW/gp25 family protein [Flavobacterium sp. J27]
MENKFLGSGWAFPPAFASGGTEVAMVSGEDDIKQSLQILLSTSVNERVMHSEFGCDLNRFLFEEVDQRFVNDISNIVSRSLLLYEPRIKVNEVTIKEVDLENGVVHIGIDYIVRTTNNRFNLVYPFYVNEASANAFTL